MASRQANAKINLTLSVTGKRADGYHLLDSLVVFANHGDQLVCTTHPRLNISVNGAFGQGVPEDNTNLAMRAAELLKTRRGVTLGATLKLRKNLPHGAGIGSGSSDAAMALSALAETWGVAPLEDGDVEVLGLGADVPVSRCQPVPQRLQGIGEQLTPVTNLPYFWMVLVNPGVRLPTKDVFAAWDGTSTPQPALPEGQMSLDTFCDWLRQTSNDLTPAASKLAPEIPQILDDLGGSPNVLWSGMSGSGATCVAILRTAAQAKHVARMMQIKHPDWWVVPTERAS